MLDLGSSPGGWSQVVRKKIVTGKILALDIKPMESIDKVTFLNGDLNDREIYKKILTYFDKKINVVISDMADFERLHNDALTRLPGVARVNSSVAIRIVTKTTELPVG